MGKPDYILLTIGGNDINPPGSGVDSAAGATHALGEIGLMLDKITYLEPGAEIILTNTTPRSDATYNAVVQSDFNPFIPGIVSQKDGLGEKV